MRHITLLTDFGTTEGEHTVLKGVIWGILPGASIADLSHDITPQNIHHAVLVLKHTAHFFPPETVHVVVVDPGVGTTRRGIAARFGNQFFVGPDNGVCTPMLERAEQNGGPIEVVQLTNPNYFLSDVSAIFHGRDVFAPVGGHLAAGVVLSEFGPPVPIGDVLRYHPPRPTINGDTIRGEVVQIDSFGNLIANIMREDIEPLRPVAVTVGDAVIVDLVNTFGEREVGELAAVYSPDYELMIAVVNGNAAARLDVRVGNAVKVQRKG